MASCWRHIFGWTGQTDQQTYNRYIGVTGPFTGQQYKYTVIHTVAVAQMGVPGWNPPQNLLHFLIVLKLQIM